MTTREKPFDRARRECIDRLSGVWTRREIEIVLDELRDEGDARTFADAVGVVNDRLLENRLQAARAAHQAAQLKSRIPDGEGGEVVELGRRRAV